MEGSFLSRKSGTLRRCLIMFPTIKTMQNEYVESLVRNKEGIISHKAILSAARSVISCEGLPPSAEQILGIHLSS